MQNYVFKSHSGYVYLISIDFSLAGLNSIWHSTVCMCVYVCVCVCVCERERERNKEK